MPQHLYFLKFQLVLADHLRFAETSFPEPVDMDASVSGPSICTRVFRVVMRVILFVSVVSLITCAAQGCLDRSPSGLDAKICDQLCPENRKLVTYVGLVVGTLGVLLGHLP